MERCTAPGYKTIDGGDSWILQNQNFQMFPYFPTGITFMNDSTGIVAGYDYWGAIYKTIDRGNSWYYVNVPLNTWEIYSVHFPSQQIGYCTSYKNAAVDESEILKTTDGGENWLSIYTTSLSSLFHSVYCTDDHTCYAVGANGNIVKTTDGGITWSTQNSGTTQTLNKVFFTDANTGYIVGDNGTFLKTINGGGVTSIQSSNSPQNVISVMPNPVQNSFNITLNGENDESLIFTLFNSIGKKIMEEIILNSSTTIDLNEYPSGIYLYRLNSGKDRVQNGKIIKL